MKLKLEKQLEVVYRLYRPGNLDPYTALYLETTDRDYAFYVMAKEQVEAKLDRLDTYWRNGTAIWLTRKRLVDRLQRFLMWKEKRLEELDSQSEG